jgi:hypothetical protein
MGKQARLNRTLADNVDSIPNRYVFLPRRQHQRNSIENNHAVLNDKNNGYIHVSISMRYIDFIIRLLN